MGRAQETAATAETEEQRAAARAHYDELSGRLAAIDSALLSWNDVGYGAGALIAGAVVTGLLLIAACPATGGAGCVAAAYAFSAAGGAAAATAGCVAYFTAESRAHAEQSRQHSLESRTYGRLCPALSTDLGRLTFARTSGGPGEPRAANESRMTVLDTIQACACENNPINRFALPGDPASGGNTCEYGKRLACLREAEVMDTGRPMSFECRQLLASDKPAEPAGDLRRRQLRPRHDPRRRLQLPPGGPADQRRGEPVRLPNPVLRGLPPVAPRLRLRARGGRAVSRNPLPGPGPVPGRWFSVAIGAATLA